MRRIKFTAAYRRDLKRLQRQDKKFATMHEVVTLLEYNRPLPSHYRDHALKGNWKGYRELHIENDWLLIYRVDGDAITLTRAGSHAELFDL